MHVPFTLSFHLTTGLSFLLRLQFVFIICLIFQGEEWTSLPGSFCLSLCAWQPHLILSLCIVCLTASPDTVIVCLTASPDTSVAECENVLKRWLVRHLWFPECLTCMSIQLMWAADDLVFLRCRQLAWPFWKTIQYKHIDLYGRSIHLSGKCYHLITIFNISA